MLSSLSIRNLALLKSLDIDFKEGLTVLSGETGAGKSILLEALSLILGAKADSQLIGPGADHLDVTGLFIIKDAGLFSALQQRFPVIQLAVAETSEPLGAQEVILRRVVHANGSKASVNGSYITTHQLKELGGYLVDLQSQHQHHALLRSDYQRRLLDDYVGSQALLDDLQGLTQQGLEVQKDIDEKLKKGQNEDKTSLLKYQLEELRHLNLQATELTDLESQIKLLSNRSSLLTTSQQVLQHLEGFNCHALLKNAEATLKEMPAFKNILDLLRQTELCVEESMNELRRAIEQMDWDGADLDRLNQRLGEIYQLARKHKVRPELLYEYGQDLEQALQALLNVEIEVALLRTKLKDLEGLYQSKASQLTQLRRQGAQNFVEKVKEKLNSLALPNVAFEIKIEPRENLYWQKNGVDEIDFLMTLNPDQPLDTLKKVASGGELSRISLAIQAVFAEKVNLPVVVFDEIDAGIGGKTAHSVAHVIKELAQHTQVICITHLAQIASKAQSHYLVSKHYDPILNQTAIAINALNQGQKKQELARLLSGNTTALALKHAEELLSATDEI